MKGISNLGIFVLWLFLGGGLYLHLFEGWSFPSDDRLFYFLLGIGVILILINSSISKIESTLMEKISNLSSSEGNQKNPSEDKIKDGKFEGFYPSGELKSIGNYFKGKKDGDWKEYFENGVLKELGTYWEGKKDGEFEVYDINGDKIQKLVFERGVLKESHQLKNNLLHGTQKYFNGGVLLKSVTYEDGKIFDGLWESFHDSGQLLIRGNYIKGKKDGLWISYHNNGKVCESGNYIDGKRKGPWVEYVSDGSERGSGNYINGMKEGFWEYWYRDLILFWSPDEDYGEPDLFTIFIDKRCFPFSLKGEYLNGKRDGLWESYYENGQLWEKGNYLIGEKEGLWEEYNDNGQLINRGDYVNGKMEGPWEFFHENGQLWEKGNYLNGLRDGLWVEYYTNGQIKRKGNCKRNFIADIINKKNHGTKNDFWESFYENGQLWEKGNYSNNFREGIWESFYENGQLWEKGNYMSFSNTFLIDKSSDIDYPPFRYDMKVGPWESYHQNGQLWERGNYSNDLRDGLWESFKDNGQLMWKTFYSRGEKQPKYKIIFTQIKEIFSYK